MISLLSFSNWKFTLFPVCLLLEKTFMEQLFASLNSRKTKTSIPLIAKLLSLKIVDSEDQSYGSQWKKMNV